MAFATIHKRPSAGGRNPNLGDYVELCRAFSWSDARAELDGLPGGGLNIAYEAVDRHLTKGRREKIALRWLAKTGEVRNFSYGALAAQTNRFANVLSASGIGKGARVLFARRPCAGTLHRGAWSAEERLRVFAVVLRLRTRARTHED